MFDHPTDHRRPYVEVAIAPLTVLTAPPASHQPALCPCPQQACSQQQSQQ